jgi:hypothetical protein
MGTALRGAPSSIVSSGATGRRPAHSKTATLTGMDRGRQTATASLEEAAGLMAATRRIVVFSGAGISTDSKIIVWTLDSPQPFPQVNGPLRRRCPELR